jgi:O-antigen/teichoic acid export membrane protein
VLSYLAVEPPKNEGISRQVALSTASNYAGRILNLGVWFGLTPLILHHLGKTQYGLWALVASFVAYGNLADIGVGAALTKYVAEFRARDDSEMASQLIATSLWMYCVLGFLVVAIFAILAPFVPDIINVPAGQRGTASWLVVITALGVAVQLPATAAACVLRGLGRFDLMNLIGSLAMVTLAVTTVAVLLLGGKVLAITALIVPLTIIWQLPAVWLIRRVAPDLRFGFRGAKRSLVRRVTVFGSALFGIQVAQVLKMQSDEIVIGASLPVRFVAPYSVARKLSTAPGQLAYQFVQVLMPLASRVHAQGDEWMLREIYLSGIRLTVAMYAAIGGGLIVFAGPFLSAWVGPSIASSSNIVVLLTLATFLEAVMSPASSALQGMARHGPLVYFALGSAALNLALSIALIGPVGVSGVAIATLVATSLEAAIVLPFAARILGVRLGQVVTQIVLPGAIPLIPMVAVLVLIRDTVAPSTIVTIALSALAGALVYIACYLAQPATGSERALARRIVAFAGRPLGR